MRHILGARRCVVARACDSANGIYPPYFERYVDTVCGSIPERVREACVRGMVLPPIEEQQIIVKDLDKLREIMPLESAEGAILLLMRDHNEVLLGALLQALANYHDALGIARSIVIETFNHI